MITILLFNVTNIIAIIIRSFYNFQTPNAMTEKAPYFAAEQMIATSLQKIVKRLVGFVRKVNIHLKKVGEKENSIFRKSHQCTNQKLFSFSFKDIP